MNGNSEIRMETKEPKKLKSAIAEVLQDINSKREKAWEKNPSLQADTNYLCSICKDTEVIWNQKHTGVRVCQCKLDKTAKAIIQRTVPEIYRNEPRLKDIRPLSRLPVSVAAQKANLKLMIANPLGGYFLQGPSGTGKSYLMWALYKESLHAGLNATFTSCRELISRLRKEEFRKSGEPEDLNLVTVEDLRANARGPYHLFIDEWGKMKDNDYAYDQLFTIVDHCRSNPSSAVLNVSTNYSEADCIEIYGEAMMRRITEMCTSIFYGE